MKTTTEISESQICDAIGIWFNNKTKSLYSIKSIKLHLNTVQYLSDNDCALMEESFTATVECELDE